MSDSVTFYCKNDDREIHQAVEGNGKSNLWAHKAPDPSQFMEARDGDHLLNPFVCHICLFRFVRGVDADDRFESDRLLVGVLKRAVLDVFWSRARSTVKTNRLAVERCLKELSVLGLGGPFYDPGPTPGYDFCGVELASAVLMDSRRRGRYSETHKQWDSIRNVRSTVSNFEKTASQSPLSNLALMDYEKGSVRRFHFGESSSHWFNRFTLGCQARMGSDVRQNQALSTSLWVKVLNLCKARIFSAESVEQGERWIMAGAYLAFTYVLSLRGPEGFMFEIGLLRQYDELRNGLIWLPIMGKLKGMTGVDTHCLRSVPVTDSGINIAGWKTMLLKIHEKVGRVEGPAICDSAGFLLTSAAMNEMFWEALEELFESEHRGLFPMPIQSLEDIRERVQIDRTPRRSSNSRATSKKVSSDDRDVVNRWSKKERAKGKNHAEKMSLWYADQELLDECFGRYTQAM